MSDGQLSDSTSFLLTVLDINRVPSVSVSDLSVDEGTTVTHLVAANDPDYDEQVRLAWCWALSPGITYMKLAIQQEGVL